MCCGTCWSDEIKVPEDRSWAETLSGGIGMDPNADPTACRNVVCLAPDCEAFDQVFDGRCCTKCKSSVSTVSAADRRAELVLSSARLPQAVRTCSAPRSTARHPSSS